MDAARRLLCRSSNLPRWDHVLVDEAQDYALIQLRLLTSLGKRAEGLCFMGDERQVVHASAFEWTRVQEAIRSVWAGCRPQVTSLETNFRNPRSVANLAHAAQVHRATRLGQPVPCGIECDRPEHPRPLYLRVPAAAIDQVMRALAERIPSLGIIFPAADRVEANRWMFHDIAFRRGFTPQSAKGLEFQVVCLVDFGRDYASLNRKARGSTATEMFRFNEIHVSITRPRLSLLLLDSLGAGVGLWEAGSFEGTYEVAATVDEYLSRTFQEVEPFEESGWRLAAMDFERQEAFGPAAECWQRSGESARAARCLAAIEDWEQAYRLFMLAGERRGAADALERLGQYAAAARLWRQAGDPANAARCFEAAGDEGEAIEAWLAAGRPERADRLRAGRHERAGEHQEAMRLWDALGDFERAAECAERSGQHELAEVYWSTLGDDSRAAFNRVLALERAGRWAEAAADWEALPDWSAAARCHEAAREYESAARCYRRAKQSNRAEVMLGLHHAAKGNDEQAARHFERGGDMRRASEAWEQAGQRRESMRTLALALEDEALWDEAAKQWMQAGNKTKAASCWRRIGEHRLAALAWRQVATEHGDAARRTEAWGEAARAFEQIEAWRDAEHAWLMAGERLKNLACGGHALFDARRYVEAADKFTRAREHEQAAHAFIEAREFLAAADVLALRVESLTLRLATIRDFKERSRLIVEIERLEQKAAECRSRL